MFEDMVPEVTEEGGVTVVENFFQLKWAAFIKIWDRILSFLESIFLWYLKKGLSYKDSSFFVAVKKEHN